MNCSKCDVTMVKVPEYPTPPDPIICKWCQIDHLHGVIDRIKTILGKGFSPGATVELINEFLKEAGA